MADFKYKNGIFYDNRQVLCKILCGTPTKIAITTPLTGRRHTTTSLSNRNMKYKIKRTVTDVSKYAGHYSGAGWEAVRTSRN